MLGIFGLVAIATLGSLAFGDIFSGLIDDGEEESTSQTSDQEAIKGEDSVSDLCDLAAEENYRPNIIGSTGDDTLSGTIGDDAIDAGGGNDEVYGLIGDDLLIGGPGADLLQGGGGQDTLLGGTGDDTLSGGLSQHPALNDAGLDELNGGEGNDTIFLQNGTLATGGSGSDEFQFSEDSVSNNIVSDFVAGQDLISIKVLSVKDIGEVSIEENESGDANLFLGDQQIGTVLGAAKLISVEDIIFVGEDGSMLGGAGADVLKGSALDDSISGLAGDDTIFGGEGSDSIHGGLGADHIYGEAGDDSIYLGNEDHGYGGAGSDVFVTSEDTDVAVIEDFEPGKDSVVIQYYSAEGTISEPEMQVTNLDGGDAVVSIDGKDVLIVVGANGSFSASDITFDDSFEQPAWWSRI
jgi:Ca2+-binding RTX toxin-like protein